MGLQAPGQETTFATSAEFLASISPARVADSECNLPCETDPEQICGGPDRVQLYELHNDNAVSICQRRLDPLSYADAQQAV